MLFFCLCDEGCESNRRLFLARSRWIPDVLSVLAVAALPITVSLPSGIVLFWASSTGYTLMQGLLLSSKKIKV